MVGDHCLNHDQVLCVLEDLQALVLSKNGRTQYELDHVTPFLDQLKEVADPLSCDLFVRDVFERWLAEKRGAQDYWVMPALAKLGGDASIAALLPRMRRWPGGASTKRIREAMYVLRLIGSPYALGHLAAMTENHPASWARRVAKEEFENAAVAHRCQIQQLADRVVLDLDLKRGGQLFDYGPRQFRGVLSEELKLVARDEHGKSHIALPTPRLTDDKVKVAEARRGLEVGEEAIERSDRRCLQATRNRTSRTAAMETCGIPGADRSASGFLVRSHVDSSGVGSRKNVSCLRRSV